MDYKIYLNDTSQPFVFLLFRGTKEVAFKVLEIAHLLNGSIPIAHFLFTVTRCSKVDNPWSF